MSIDRQKFQKVWGHGYYEGRSDLLMEQGLMLSEAKYERSFNALSSIAKKVFASVPHQSLWDSGQICGDLNRTGRCVEKKIVDGCLHSLIGSGLVREPRKGQFQRVPVKKKDSSQKEKAKKMTSLKVVSKPSQESSVDRMAAFISSLQEKADEIKAIATEMDAVVLEIMEGDPEIEKLKAPKSALDNLVK